MASASPVMHQSGHGAPGGLFVHRKFIVGSTPSNPINLKEGVKAGLRYSRKRCLKTDGKRFPTHLYKRGFKGFTYFPFE